MLPACPADVFRYTADGTPFPLPATKPLRREGGGSDPAEQLEYGPEASLSQILGRPTERPITLNVLSTAATEAYAEWGVSRGEYTRKSVRASAAISV